MISKLSVENRNINSISLSAQNNKGIRNEQTPSFKGVSPLGALFWGMQKCEENPMINVAVVDMMSAILPRTYVESKTNWFAGFEAFRREASGLVVNCMIPGAIAWLSAVGLNKLIMPKGASLSSCWAEHSLINKITDIYSNSNANDKSKAVIEEILLNVEGVDGKDPVSLSKAIKENIDSYSERLNKLVKSNKKENISKETKKIAKEIADKAHIFENIKVKADKDINIKSLDALLDDTVRFLKAYKNVENNITIEEFAKKGKKLVKGKSAIGLAIILPLAASMQYINRWITEKASGTKGAPIYEDFGTNDNEEIRKKSKEGLLKQKIISISSMIGVALLSMMKRPSWGMLEFKGWFPTMDQARVISTTTFASRMAVADDKNELAEATVRDIATFSGLYFLGDYAGKAMATILQKRMKVSLLNDTKPLNGDENILRRFWHWVKDVNIKSSEEVVSKTAKTLEERKIKPDERQLEIIKKEIKKAKNCRYGCQATNLGVSLILLGFVVPLWTRNKTKKKHEEALRQANSEKNFQVVSSET